MNKLSDEQHLVLKLLISYLIDDYWNPNIVLYGVSYGSSLHDLIYRVEKNKGYNINTGKVLNELREHYINKLQVDYKTEDVIWSHDTITLGAKMLNNADMILSIHRQNGGTAGQFYHHPMKTVNRTFNKNYNGNKS